MNPEDFWRLDCPERGPALSHTHTGGPNCERDSHAECPCRHCNVTPLDFARREMIEKLADPDSLPLALKQPYEDQCAYRHESLVTIGLLINDAGLERRTCPGCHVPLEPKMATGQLAGPLWGTGRGWVNPRTRNKWEAIAFRFRGLFG